MQKPLHHPTDIADVSVPDNRWYCLRRNAASAATAVPLHYHNHYELFFVLCGTAVYTVEGRHYALSPGDLLVIRPFELHQMQAQADTVLERIGLRIQAQYLRAQSDAQCDLTACFAAVETENSHLFCVPDKERKALQALLEALLQEQTGAELGAARLQEALLVQIFVLLNRTLPRHALQPPLSDASMPLVQKVLAYLEQNYTQPISLQDLQNKFYANKAHISREFTRLVGCPPHRYLLQKRLQQTAVLLCNGVRPQEAAVQCGFSDYTNFYRRFLQMYGMSPRAYAKNPDTATFHAYQLLPETLQNASCKK